MNNAVSQVNYLIFIVETLNKKFVNDTHYVKIHKLVHK